MKESNENLEHQTSSEKATGLLLQFLKDCKVLGIQYPSSIVGHLMQQLVEAKDSPLGNAQFLLDRPQHLFDRIISDNTPGKQDNCLCVQCRSGRNQKQA